MKFSLGAVALVAGILAPSGVFGAPKHGLLDLIETRDITGEPELDQVDTRDTTADISPRTGHDGCNAPHDRACWSNGFDIKTDYETTWPNTGKTRHYTLTLTEIDNWAGPDGFVKDRVMLVNNKIVGPTIFADWGDIISVTVINNMISNGTSIHWHGMHMRGTQIMDGANGVTECPTAPGKRRLYKFRATQHGSSWYHSHFSAQYGNGIVGSIQINGPASKNYDIDLGVFPIQDYYYETADRIMLRGGFPPKSDNVLFNGSAKHPVTGAGDYAKVTLTHGKTHRLRLINPSVENHFQLSLVNHKFTIIAADLIPVKPKTVDSVFLGVGQRLDVLIEAKAAKGNYWFNATFGGQVFCGDSHNVGAAAIFQYQGAPAGLPTIPGTAPADHQCLDDNTLVPIVKRQITPGNFAPDVNNKIPVRLDVTGGPIFIWKVNGSSITVDWDKPVFDYVLTSNTSYPSKENIIHVPQKNKWVYWLIENDPDGRISIPHPFHLHGHDFLVVGRSQDEAPGSQVPHVFDPAVDNARLNGNNPTRRDVAMLPAKGWLLIAFKTDNPGAWLMHCHIAWHVSGGLSVDFLERADDIRNQMSQNDKNAFNQVCRDWRAYTPIYPKEDSGLRRL